MLITSLFLLVHIVVVGVVASQCDERAQPQSVGKEDLCCCIQPHLSGDRHPTCDRIHTCKHVTRRARKAYLRPDQLVEVWSNVEANPVYGSRQSDPTEEQDKQHEVGISGGEIHHLGEREERQQRPFRAEINGDVFCQSKKEQFEFCQITTREKKMCEDGAGVKRA